MEQAAQIGPTIRIKGDVSAQEPLTVAGQVEGSIVVTGHPLTIATGASVNATVESHTIHIAGSVDGTVSAEARIVVRETATIEGHLSAPVVSLADGATVHGRIDTGARSTAKLQLVS